MNVGLMEAGIEVIPALDHWDAAVNTNNSVRDWALQFVQIRADCHRPAR
ncbi:MAG: hypothetical protein OXI38_14280 [Bacteroidota bacterium]|nr:hypothetical protein [Bacteroidota bacterium]